MAITNATRLADFGTGIGTDGAVLKVDNTNDRVGLGTTNPQNTVTVGAVGASGTSLFVHGDGRVTGVLTAGNFSGDLTGAVTSSGALSVTDTTASTSTTSGALKVSGGVGIAKSLFVGEGVSIAGTITYNDVTNIDSVGIVTARGGVKVGPLAGVAATIYLTGDAHFIGVVTAGSISGGSSVSATTYYGSGANLSGIEGGVAGVNTTGFSTFTTVSVGGISTFVGLVTTGDIVSSGIITAKAFIPTAGQLSNRNLVINGDFTVAQRGITTTATGYGTVDRFQIGYGGHDEVLTTSQHSLTSSDTGPWGEGFRKSYHVQNGNQTSGADAADYCQVIYKPEGQDINRSGWHFTEPNSKVTLSFWIQSSVAQNFYGFIEASGPTRVFPWETGTLSANTWKKVTVTIPGYASLVIPDTSAQAFSLAFLPYYGTNYTHASARAVGSWYDATPYCPDNTSTWWTTNDSTYEITGIQLEVGSVATPFEHRPFRDELLSCQRYYVRKGSPLTPIGDGGGYFTAYTQGSSNKFVGTYWYPIQLRGSPSSVEWSGIVGMYGGTCDNDGEIVATAIGNSHNCDTSSRIHLTVSSVSGGKGGLVMSKSTSGYFAWSAEL